MADIFWPARSPVVTEEAGTRGGTHSGIDLAAKRGDPVLAPFDGVAVYVGGDGATGRLWLGDRWLYPNGEGRTVDIRRADGLISRVGHLNGYAIKQGQTVKAGQVVGYAGDSGYSTGVHIHWELRWDRAWSGGNWINPRTLTPKSQEDIVTPQDIEKIAQRTAQLVLSTPVKQTGKGRTGTLTLRGLIGSWHHQIGVTRRIVESTNALVKKLTGK
ncbi:M23 family metallopeptidase [Leucobacter salsicius]|uniref:M23 family metallopeptidase n=1 Tax=Leucobacter salsicius TaxID=664638 RepID=UPI0003488CC5|nr:M23 family metallopeptidase [Leucobacter salsicius]